MTTELEICTSAQSADSAHAGKGLWRQRIGYGLADLACNLIWVMITLYLMFFYTDVMELSAVSVGVLFLVTRLVDGVADMAMGFLIDKTNTRWGKSRPYFLIGAIPFGLLAIAAFWVPPFGHTGKLIYAYITYLGLSLAYTLVNIPLASILPSLTPSAHERTNLATIRILFAFIGATFVSAFALKMVQGLGNGSQAHGFFLTMLIFGSIGAILFFVTFANVEEKVRFNQQHVTLRQALSSLKGNTPWYLFAVNILFMWGGYFFQQGALIYYFAYYVGRKDFAGVVASINSLVPIVGTFLTPFLAGKMQKRTVFLYSSALHVLGLVIMLIAGTDITGIVIGTVVASLFGGTRMSIYFSMQADPVDYGEWKSGISAAGLLSSCNGFIGKIAMAVAGAVSGALMTWAHYVPNGEQPASAITVIRMNYMIIPIAMVIISMCIMYFYRLDAVYPRIRAELDARHREQH